MREAERIADRIVMIHQGKMLKEGTWSEMKEDTGIADLDDIFIHYVSARNNHEIEVENETGLKH